MHLCILADNLFYHFQSNLTLKVINYNKIKYNGIYKNCSFCGNVLFYLTKCDKKCQITDIDYKFMCCL